MIIETCPACGSDLIHVVLTSYPPKHMVQCTQCGWRYVEEDKIERVPWVSGHETMNDVPENCRYCKNHPSNGGTGICHCILGNPGMKC